MKRYTPLRIERVKANFARHDAELPDAATVDVASCVHEAPGRCTQTTAGTPIVRVGLTEPLSTAVVPV